VLLETLTEKHKRCSQGLGIFKHDLLEGKDDLEANSALDELEKEGVIEGRVGTFWKLYKLTKKFKKANKLW